MRDLPPHGPDCRLLDRMFWVFWVFFFLFFFLSLFSHRPLNWILHLERCGERLVFASLFLIDSNAARCCLSIRYSTAGYR